MTPTSPYSIDPPSLTNDHFFEPAMHILSTGFPAVSEGSGKVSAVAAPLDIEIFAVAEVDLVSAGSTSAWLLKAINENETPKSAIAPTFDQIKGRCPFVCSSACTASHSWLLLSFSGLLRLRTRR